MVEIAEALLAQICSMTVGELNEVLMGNSL